MPEKTLTLRVADAYQRDVGRGIARVDPKVVDALGLTSGDVIQIVGKKKTTALSWPGYESQRSPSVSLWRRLNHFELWEERNISARSWREGSWRGETMCR